MTLAELDAGVDLTRFVRAEVRNASAWSSDGVVAGVTWLDDLVADGVVARPPVGSIPRAAPRAAIGAWANEFPSLVRRGIVEPYDASRHGTPCIVHPTFATGSKVWEPPAAPDRLVPHSRRNDPVLSSDPTRLILDARCINAVLDAPPFQYDAYDVALGAVSPGSFMAVCDVKSGYHCVLIAETSRRLLGVYGPDGTPYVYRRMPFGLSVAPLLFCGVSATALAIEEESRGKFCRVVAEPTLQNPCSRLLGCTFQAAARHRRLSVCRRGPVR
jgi:hypothetical protein